MKMCRRINSKFSKKITARTIRPICLYMRMYFCRRVCLEGSLADVVIVVFKQSGPLQPETHWQKLNVELKVPLFAQITA